MQCPSQALHDGDAKVSDLHHGPIHVKGRVVPPLLLPKFHDQLLSLAGVQKEVVVLKPVG